MKTIQNDLTYPLINGVGQLTGGLTKLEYFAAIALQGNCAAAADIKIYSHIVEQARLQGMSVNQYMAKDAVNLAKCLIDELNKS